MAAKAAAPPPKGAAAPPKGPAGKGAAPPPPPDNCPEEVDEDGPCPEPKPDEELQQLLCFKTVEFGCKNVEFNLDPESTNDEKRRKRYRQMILHMIDEGEKEDCAYVEYDRACGKVILVRTFIPPIVEDTDPEIGKFLAARVFDLLKRACLDVDLQCDFLYCIYLRSYRCDEILNELIKSDPCYKDS